MSNDKCHVMAEAMAKRCSNRVLQKIELEYRDSPVISEEFLSSIPCKIIGAGIHKDSIFWILNNDFSIWCTPSPTGTWKETSNKHTRIKVILNDGEVCYNDRNKSVAFELVQGRKAILEKLQNEGK